MTDPSPVAGNVIAHEVMIGPAGDPFPPLRKGGKERSEIGRNALPV